MQFDMNSGKPIPLSELKYRLLELNQNGDIPFSVIEQEDTLVASWNIVDAKWIELFGVGGLKNNMN
ncbi:hypothetical protein ACP6OW_000820 [Cronobacter turicensis]